MSSRGARCRRYTRVSPPPACRSNSIASARPQDFNGTVIDCRGIDARDACPTLRGVKGEMIVVESREIALSRPVRLMHPRLPLYIVPRADICS